MHDEFERAFGVRRRPGISLLGWLGIGLAAVVLLGATGVFFAFRAVSSQVQEVVERVQVRSSAQAPELVARTVARTLAEMGTAPDVDQDGLATVVARALALSGTDPAGSGSGTRSAPLQSAAEGPASGGEEMEGFLRIRTNDGEVRADLRAGEDGGRLVIRDADGEVLVELSGDSGGGRLYLRGEGEVASFQAGGAATGPPEWIPAVADGGEEKRAVLSGRAGEGTFGAQTWLTGSSPEALVERFRARLQGEGWEVRAEHRLRDQTGVSASVVGRRDSLGRTVLLTAGPEDGRTRVVLGWGEEAPPGR